MSFQGVFPKARTSGVQSKGLQGRRKISRTTSRQEVDQTFFKTIRLRLEGMVQGANNQIRECILFESTDESVDDFK